MSVPAGFDQALNDGWALVRETPGYLTEREARFIMTAIALAPATGLNVEIGSFRGRSTVGLAAIARRYDLGQIVAIDPHNCPSPTDPLPGQGVTTLDDFVANLERAKMREVVDVRRAYSGDEAKAWKGQIRFLWIDGDHRYEGARDDIRMFKPWLADGAVVAMHDVLGTWEGTLRAFDEEILGSTDFGEAGFCGSIAWTQYRPAAGASLRTRLNHRALSLPVRCLIPIAMRGKAEFGEEKLIRLHGGDKWRYKLWRTMLPHGLMSPASLSRSLNRR